jgi:hypothetical protein
MARSDASTTVLVNLDAGAPYGTERKVQSWRGQDIFVRRHFAVTPLALDSLQGSAITLHAFPAAFYIVRQLFRGHPARQGRSAAHVRAYEVVGIFATRGHDDDV